MLGRAKYFTFHETTPDQSYMESFTFIILYVHKIVSEIQCLENIYKIYALRDVGSCWQHMQINICIWYKFFHWPSKCKLIFQDVRISSLLINVLWISTKIWFHKCHCYYVRICLDLFIDTKHQYIRKWHNRPISSRQKTPLYQNRIYT